MGPRQIDGQWQMFEAELNDFIGGTHCASFYSRSGYFQYPLHLSSYDACGLLSRLKSFLLQDVPVVVLESILLTFSQQHHNNLSVWSNISKPALTTSQTIQKLEVSCWISSTNFSKYARNITCVYEPKSLCYTQWKSSRTKSPLTVMVII